MKDVNFNLDDELSIAIWQTPFLSCPEQVLEQMEVQAETAKMAGADLLVCPEMIMTGYAIGIHKLRHYDYNDQQNWTLSIARIAQKNRIAIVYGFPDYERGPAIYNACQFISEQGEVLAQYAKTHLFGELDRAQFSAGPIIGGNFIWRGWRVGMLICYDIEFASAARTLAQQGLDLLVVPTANMKHFDQVPQILVPARAYENNCYVVYANAVGQESIDGECIDYGGLSTVASPLAQLVQANSEAQLLMVRINKKYLCTSRSTSQLKDQRLDLYI